MNDVDREALHDWLDQRDGLDSDRPSAAELSDDDAVSYPAPSAVWTRSTSEYNDDLPF